MLSPADLLTLHDLVASAADVSSDRPMVFKSVGMSSQDLVVAEAAVQRLEGRSPAAAVGAAVRTDDIPPVDGPSAS